jgi:TolA-binding protein
MRKSFFPLLAATFLVAAEPSAFQAGDMSLDQPYGLTPTEKMIHQNRQAIIRLERRLATLEEANRDLQTRVDGMTEMVSGNGEALRQSRREISRLEETVAQNSEDEQLQSEALSEEMALLREEMVAAVATQDGNHRRLAEALSALEKGLAQSANREAVERSLKQLVAEIETNREEIAKLRGVTTPLALDQSAPEAILEEAKALIEKRDYTNAKRRLEALIERDHNLGESYFYLGTIHYFRQEDDRAIAAFKRSAEIDDQARHMPVLLFYTAIALNRQGNEDEAKRFFETLIRLYPEHSVTPSARSRLEKLSS